MSDVDHELEDLSLGLFAMRIAQEPNDLMDIDEEIELALEQKVIDCSSENTILREMMSLNQQLKSIQGELLGLRTMYMGNAGKTAQETLVFQEIKSANQALESIQVGISSLRNSMANGVQDRTTFKELFRVSEIQFKEVLKQLAGLGVQIENLNTYIHARMVTTPITPAPPPELQVAVGSHDNGRHNNNEGYHDDDEGHKDWFEGCVKLTIIIEQSGRRYPVTLCTRCTTDNILLRLQDVVKNEASMMQFVGSFRIVMRGVIVEHDPFDQKVELKIGSVSDLEVVRLAIHWYKDNNMETPEFLITYRAMGFLPRGVSRFIPLLTFILVVGVTVLFSVLSGISDGSSKSSQYANIVSVFAGWIGRSFSRTFGPLFP